MEVLGKVALVTGGTRGIGKAIVLDLAQNGVDVALTYKKSHEEGQKVVNLVKELGRKGLAIQADTAIFTEAQKTVDKVLQELGRLDILVNNAGISWDGVVWKMSEEQWDTVIATDLKGYFNYIRVVAPIFKEQKFGKIINITSINGLRGKFGQSNYSAAKAGVIGLTKAVARELGKYDINVNAVAPGMITTEMMQTVPEEIKERARDESVLGKLGTPDDVAHLVTFLVTERAKHITGEIIKVDGGQYI